MTKTKLIGGIVAMALMFTTSSVAVNAIPSEQVYAKSNAPIATEALEKPVVINKATTKPNKKKKCKNWLVQELHDTGFRGKNLREAWAIVMRESGGREDAISATNDYGMFQFNRAAWSGQDWWDSNKLLTREYNAKVAFRISRGGKTWYPWDIDGQGRHKGAYTSSGTYSTYVKWYNKYPCK
jgi:hypothetical protein